VSDWRDDKSDDEFAVILLWVAIAAAALLCLATFILCDGLQ
jgi:hypothetical protein